MNREELNQRLKDASLSKKEFAKYLNTSYNTVNAWGSNGREVPYWVKSWINLYACCRNGFNLRKILKKNVCGEIADFKLPFPKIDD